MNGLLEMLIARYREPDPLPYAFQLNQAVRVLSDIASDGQTPVYWAGAKAIVVRRYTTGLHKEHFYVVRSISSQTGRECEFRESELDQRYRRKPANEPLPPSPPAP